ncbi:MAG: proline iminopeptidase-family hydrolase [Flavobacteriales bacterium]
MMTKSIGVTFLLAAILHSCNESKSDSNQNKYFLPHTEGIQDGGVQVIPIETPKGKFNVWTKCVGNNPKTRVLLLNGGPGCTHEYFECFENFLPAEGIEFIYYDQLGCGHSDNPDDTAMWDLKRYVEEVEQVRKALNLNSDNFYLLGHSWGGILALDYAMKYQHNLKALIISNMMCSAPLYDKYADEVLAGTIDAAVLDTIRRIEAAGDFSNPKYMQLLEPHFYQQHICRIPAAAWPEPMTRSFSKLNQSLYVSMQGPSEFGISGKLENWDRSTDLDKIKIPCLTIGAKHDSMDPEHMRWMSTQVKNGSHVHCPDGSHMCFYDDQTVYFKGLIDFIKQTEANPNK